MAKETGKAGARRALAAVARGKALLPFWGGEGGQYRPAGGPFPQMERGGG